MVTVSGILTFLPLLITRSLPLSIGTSFFVNWSLVISVSRWSTYFTVTLYLLSLYVIAKVEKLFVVIVTFWISFSDVVLISASPFVSSAVISTTSVTLPLLSSSR